MRDTYALSHVFVAIDAWEKHQKQYLAVLQKAKAPLPSAEVLDNYKHCFIEAYLEALADASAEETAQS